MQNNGINIQKLIYRKALKRIIIYFVLIMLAFILQTCLFPLFSFLWIVPNLLLIITVSYGLSYGTSTGMICGIFAGLMMDLFYSEPFGLFILIYCYLGYFSGLFKENYRTDALIFPLSICFISDLMYNAVMLLYRVFIIGAAGNIGFILGKIIFPEMFFTMLVTIIAYRVLLSTNKKLDRIDDFRGQNAA